MTWTSKLKAWLLKTWLVRNMKWFFLAAGVITVARIVYSTNRDEKTIPGSHIEPHYPLPVPGDWK